MLMKSESGGRAYHEKAVGYFGHVRREILPLLPEKMGRVLEVGCGSGDTLSYIKQHQQCDWACGIELTSSAASAARKKLDLLIEGSIETIDLPIEAGSLDVILCLDVLEHLADPWSVVRKLHELLTPGGVIIVSIPNVRHFRVVLPLLFQGRWEYCDAGILDKTHLRFFTRDSAIALLEDSGFIVQQIVATGLEKGSKARIANRATLSLLSSFFEVQYLIRASKVQ